MSDETAQVWETGVYDAHCHPTDDLDSLAALADRKTRRMLIMSTRIEDIDVVAQTASQHASKVVPAFGFHPWFSHKFYVGDYVSKRDHYRAVLRPEPDDDFVDTLPEPVSFEQYLAKMRKYLDEFPEALVGELGVDRAFRLPFTTHEGGFRPKQLSPYKVDMSHQIQILEMQLKIAVEYGRKVSLHGVQAHNTLYEVVKRTTPPRVCLHSYSGSQQFFNSTWYRDPALRDRVFVSCSVLINVNTEERARKLLEGIPPDRVMTESDYHSASSELDELNMRSLQNIAQVYGWSLAEAAVRCKDNFERFFA